VTADTVVVDASVLVAIFKTEADAAQLAERIFSYRRRAISAATWLEAAMVCESASTKAGGAADFAQLVTGLSLEVIPLTYEQAQLALAAFMRFSKGRGAKASLNFGDCFTYALAKELAAPLLFKGNDFIHTDLQRA
jgi:ribonuclease VapC